MTANDIRSRHRRKPFFRVFCHAVLDNLLVVAETPNTESSGESYECEISVYTSYDGGMNDERAHKVRL